MKYKSSICKYCGKKLYTEEEINLGSHFHCDEINKDQIFFPFFQKVIEERKSFFEKFMTKIKCQ